MGELKTVKIEEAFFGEKEFTLKEFQRRWLGSSNEIWAFLIDHGNKEERDFGQKLVEDIIPQVTEKAFNKFYEKQKNEENKT
tara:strand:+ start:269 stop:514 length:246 start_codon:yes stop_codon:yes gene_type:complete